MRSYAKLMLSTWDADQDFDLLSMRAQWLYWVLMSHPLLSSAGVLPLQPRQWSKRCTDTDRDEVEDALRELIENDKVLIDEDTEEVMIRTFIHHDGGARNPNLGKSIQTAITQIESAKLRELSTVAFAAALEGNEPPKGLNDQRAGSGVDPCQDPDVDRPESCFGPTTPSPTPTTHRLAAKDPGGFSEFWADYPKKKNRAKALAAWKRMKGADRELARAALPAHKAQWKRDNPNTDQFIPFASSWLNAKRWEDDLTVAPNVPKPRPDGLIVTGAI